MTRRVLVSCITLLVGSLLLFSLARSWGGWTLFLTKLGILIGGGACLCILVSLKLFGRHSTDAMVTNAIVLLTSLVLLTLISEFAVRFIFRDVTTTGDNRSYFAGKWKEDNVRLNSRGFREIEYNPDKSDGLYRIAVIGDSLTFGQGIPEKARFSNLIENYLCNTGRYQVLNFGKCGAETVHHLAFLRDVVLKANPDFVILQWFVNDFEGENKKGRPKYLPLLPFKLICSSLHRTSALYYLINRKWQSIQNTLGLTDSYVEYMKKRFNSPQSPVSVEVMAMLSSAHPEMAEFQERQQRLLRLHYNNNAQGLAHGWVMLRLGAPGPNLDTSVPLSYLLSHSIR